MRSARLESNIPGVFVIGDGAGVRGAAVAMEEGRIAATWAAANAGRITEEEARKRISPAMRRLKSLQKFAQAISEIYSPPEGLYSRISDEVIVCRCEDVRAGEIRSAMSKGFLTMDSIKGRTRAGMGNCQGRICGPTITELISLKAGLRPIEITPSRCRPPIKPVPIGDIAGLRG
jgi:NAD(P)H-nitrite reductase large subunit